MPGDSQQVLGLIARVRARWRRLIVLRGTIRAALAASAVLAAALVLASLGGRSPFLLVLVGVAAAVLVPGAVIWGLWPARQRPSNARVARFVEEADPSLDDRLVSAVDLLDSGPSDSERVSALAAPMLADASRRASAVEPDAVVSGDLLRRVGLKTVLALSLVLAIGYVGRDAARQSADALSFVLFPSRAALEVVPGSIRIQVGAPLRIEARLVGSVTTVDVRVLRAEEPGEHGDWTSTGMVEAGSGAYSLDLDAVDRAFTYRVVAGGLTSDTYEVRVARPPQVARIDVEYSYPPELGTEPHVEEDSGDVYAPAGTAVRLRIHADGEGVTGRLRLGEGTAVDLKSEGAVLIAGFTVERDSSYRVALADVGGLTSAGDTEYFIRVLDDRPPQVRVLRPARDREVTRLEEVEVEAEAVDDFGVDRFELVYSVAGGEEHVLPFDVRRGSAAVAGERILYLEDLDVHIGDFLSYYVRARDRARGRRAVEARSDMFFLQVKPFEQEFAAASSQATGGGSTDTSLDELVDAQKEIIVATWQLDRRAQASGGSRSEEDIQAVARAEAELKTRVERTSSSMRASTMRDPRRRPQLGGPPGHPVPKAGQTSAEENALTSAAVAMGQAVTALEALQTGDAMSPEMSALTHLLKARGEVTERQVMRQQAGSGAGASRSNEDLSGLFDRELQRLQQTSYETPTTAETRKDPGETELDRVRELARRQDELLREQQELDRERDGLSEEDLERELERLTRAQAELRQQAEALAQRMSRQQSSSQSSQSNGPSSGGAGQQAERQLRLASEEMRSAATELTRQDSGQALVRSSSALEQLRQVEHQLENATPDGQRRALGDLQLEARQIGEAERQVSDELGRLDDGTVAQDSMRHLAGEQERLAERVRRLQDALEVQASGQKAGDSGDEQSRLQRAARDVAEDFADQRLDERMQESAEAMRRASETSNGGDSTGEIMPDSPNSTDGAGDSGSQPARDVAELRQEAEDAGRTLERLADALAAARTGNEESRRLTDQLAQTRRLRERMDSLSRQLERLDQTSRRSAGSPDEQAASPSQSGASGQGSGNAEAAGLQEEYNRRLRETRELVEQLGREDPSLNAGGAGFTLQEQGMVLSAPGTEAFKQDFATWEELRRQVTEALARAESSLSRRLNAEVSRDRLTSGIEDNAPAEYQRQVDDYFKALAGRGRR